MDILVALVNSWPDGFRFWMLDNSSLFDTLAALGYTVFEDGSVIP